MRFFKRFGEIVELWSEESSLENEDGTVISTNLRQGLGKNQMMELAGKVTDKGLEVAIRNVKNEQKETIPWPAGVVGVGREASILKEMKPKPATMIDAPVLSAPSPSPAPSSAGAESHAPAGGAAAGIEAFVGGEYASF